MLFDCIFKKKSVLTANCLCVSFVSSTIELCVVMNHHRTDDNQKRQHPRIECVLCGMKISQKHLGRHRMRRHPDCPNTDVMTNFALNRSSKPPKSESTSKTERLPADIRQTIDDQSKKPYSDEIRFVKVRMSEQELIKLMNRGRIYHAVGKFFMYDS